MSSLKQKNIDVYVFMNPFLAKGSVLFNEAQGLGHLIQRHNNDTYLIGGDHAQKGMVDLTSEAAYNWFKGRLGYIDWSDRVVCTLNCNDAVATTISIVLIGSKVMNGI